ncbi:hypothetical protein, partial [Sphingobium yanoikuyae]|uniref:hypothetical protein n=1 Tax=Sphingobium yanoikuyae TaxID=13690 RepID=UPI001BE4A0CD
NNAMSNTPYTLACQSQGRVQHGSILSGNLRPTRVTSQWKSTALIHHFIVSASKNSDFAFLMFMIRR